MTDTPITLPTLPLDELAIRQIITDVDRVTTGRRRIDIAHALLNIVGMEIASNAASAAAAKHHGQIIARQLKAFVRDEYAARQRRTGATLDMPMLSGWSAPTIVVTCRVCGRRDEHDVAPILSRGDVRLTDLRSILTKDCPQRDAFEIRDRCNTFLIGPDEPEPPAAGLRLAG